MREHQHALARVAPSCDFDGDGGIVYIGVGGRVRGVTMQVSMSSECRDIVS